MVMVSVSQSITTTDLIVTLAVFVIAKLVVNKTIMSIMPTVR